MSTLKKISTTEVNEALAKSFGLSAEEYKKVLEIMGRTPNHTELGIFSVMWSEHCSYKSTRLHLKKLPTTAPWVICGPGENAGVIDIGDGLAAIFKMESHNHPSFIEPYQGAATGVGGILRDVFTMGARPVALMNALRFGEPTHPKTKHLVSGVVAGIGGYGNCVGVPTVGGECNFHKSYNGNILVNAMTVGIADKNKIFYSAASSIGSPVVYVGAKTGRDGIHGATMASAEFDEKSEEKRPTVQVGDPFTEKLLIEACLELMATDAILSIQDMGAAGLTSSSLEMAGKGGTGIELYMDKVPTREEGMTPYEMMLSESQERMLMVIKPEKEDLARKIFEKWELSFAVIGKITDTGRIILKMHGEVAADMPINPLSEEAPLYERPFELYSSKAYIKKENGFDTKRLGLRPFLESEESLITELFANSDVNKFFPEKYKTLEGAKEIFSRFIKNISAMGMKAVFEKATGKFVGFGGISYLEGNQDNIEIGYVFHKEFWGNGYGVELANACAQYVFEVLGQDNVVAIANPKNHYSTNVMQKIGMDFEKMYFHKTSGVEVVFYSVSKESYYLKQNLGFIHNNENLTANEILKQLLSTPDLASKRWIYEQYDSQVGNNTIARSGGDAAIVRVGNGSSPTPLPNGEGGKGIAITTDCTPRYCLADPVEGGKQAVAETWRNITAVGAKPLAITNCLNFGNPEKPRIMGQIVGALQGMRDACLALDYPIISGNVSLYNETSGVAVQPTPAIGGVGVIADVARAVGNAFLKPNESIILIGETKGHVGASIYLREIEGSEEGAPPRVDLTLERKNGDFVRGLIESGKVSACHDISDGGLYVAIFEMAIRNKIGAKILVPTGNSSAEKKQLIAYLFGEDQARYIITTDNAEDILSLARDAGVSITIIGQTNSSGNLSINGEFVTLEELGHIYESALPDIMA
jgi:phosphoribosylformylglycinamidine (FGAM) synthase-like enzyme